MRKPNRTPVEKVEDGFYDLSLDDQERVLVWLAKAHEICKRERERKCAKCGGTGVTCPSGPSDAPMETCSDCLGTGRRA